jgi:16S rRNA (uracil1498-N3)-methyltransferase
MSRRRWIADKVSDNRAALIGDHANHLVRVLRARVGQEFDIVADAVVRRGRIVSLAEGRVDFELAESVPTPVAANVSILLAIFKFDRMEWAIEKCTELGVQRVVPVIARRTDSHLATAAGKRVERWRRLAIQAAEQSRRTAPPEVSDPEKLSNAVQSPGQTRIVLSEAEDQTPLRDLLTENHGGQTVLAIGPEGGWTEDELHLFQKHGWAPATLGQTILRAETAAIAATAITMSVLGSR